MTKNRYIFLFSLFITLICMGTQCDKDEIEYQYNFLEEVEIRPKQPSYHINDTIWLEYTNSDHRFYDQKTGQRIRVDTASFGLAFVYQADYNITSNPVPLGGFCDVVIPTGMSGSFYNRENFTRVSIGYGCNFGYDFKIGIVPKVKGRHMISFFDQTYVLPCNSVGTTHPSIINYKFSDSQRHSVVMVE